MLVGRAVARHGLTGIRGDVDELPLADNSVDVMCFLDVLEHLIEPQRALREAARVLVPGGRVVINVRPIVGCGARRTRCWDTFAATRAPFSDNSLPTPASGRYSSHVFSWLVGPVLLKRRFSGGRGPELGLDQSSVSLDRAAMVLTSVERALLRRVRHRWGRRFWVLP